MTFELHYHYVILIFTLFIVPKFLQRYRIPTAVTSISLGLICSLGFDLFKNDPTVELLSMFGIVTLFLFAGLEVNFKTLLGEKKVLREHLIISFLALIVGTACIHFFFKINLRPSALIALAILTPSTGFILDSISAFKFDPQDEFWIKTKAISQELLALGTLFFVLQSRNWEVLLISSAVLATLFLMLPYVFRFFAKRIIPFAPKSEFAFLVMIAIICGLVTKELGVYYLVGAFLVGLSAQQFLEKSPEINSEKMLSGVELFSSFFIPFYFFHAGLKIQERDLSWAALAIGATLLFIVIPFRIGKVSLHRRITLNEDFKRRFRIAMSMTPTLVFTLVLAEILKTRYQIRGPIFGGLIIYALLNTMLPSLVFRTPTPDFEDPHIPDAPLNRKQVSKRVSESMFSHEPEESD